jgi:hypothetical protein
MFKITILAFVALISSCSILGSGIPSTSTVTSDTVLVVSSTREAVLFLGPTAEATLNAYVLACHSFLTTLAQGIQAGTAALPLPATVQSQLVALAASFGSPSWALNMAGNLATEYGKFYTSVGTNSATIYAYVNAFAVGTV